MCIIPEQIVMILRKWLRSSCCQQGPTIKMCMIPYEIITAFIKTMKVHYVLKGIHENPETRITKKRAQQQKTLPGGYRSYTRFSLKVDEMCTSPKRKRPDVVHLAQQ